MGAGGVIVSMQATVKYAVILAACAGSVLAMAGDATPRASTPWISLDQFGPVDTPSAAEAAFKKAVRTLESTGGGVLVIPVATAAGWTPTNQTQEQLRMPPPPLPATSWRAGPGVTIVDVRGGALRVAPPQSTGMVLARHLKLPTRQCLPDGLGFPMVMLDAVETAVRPQASSPAAVVRASTTSHTENQTFDICIWRHAYSQGDASIVDARLRYMGDMRSTAGAGGGAIYNASVESLTDVFRGTVDRYDSNAGLLVFTAAANADTLGSGRPIVNLNPAKHVTSDTTFIMEPGGGLLGWGGSVRSTDPAWHAGLVGRFFAIDEPSEYVPGTAQVRRWWLIAGFEEEGGVKRLSITRHWWGAKHGCGISQLYDPRNFTSDPDRPRYLRSIIAPGAYAYDVADGVASAIVNPNGSARTLRLAPGASQSGSIDFSPGDPIEQAIGPDPFRPQPFRSWLFEKVPGAFPAPVFDVVNGGEIQRDSVLWVRGEGLVVPHRQPGGKQPSLKWAELVTVEASCGTGIAFKGDTTDAAIRFEQPTISEGGDYGDRANRIVWKWSDLAERRRIGRTTLGVDARGTLCMQAPAFDVAGSPAVRVGGLSTGRQSTAATLRGMAVPVVPQATSVHVRFERPGPADAYVVIARTTWITNHAVRDQDVTGFAVDFDRPAPPNATIDWFVVH